MSLFLMVQLVHEDNRGPAVVSGRERSMCPLVGVTTTTIHRIVMASHDRTPAVPAGVFAFTDLSVRQEGHFRLRFILFEIRAGEAVKLTQCDSEGFQVFTAKKFPGMEQSTWFTDLLKKHGIRVRVSKSIRTTKKTGTQVEPEPSSPKFDPEDDPQRRTQLSIQRSLHDPDIWVQLSSS
jgi:Velvet factor